MKVIAIAAVAKNGVMGRDLDLPWDIPEDMKFFKDSTREQIVIMGRKTYQALKKALPKRENAVITRDPNFKVSDARVFHVLEDAIAFYKAQENLNGKTIFVIGGAEIYKLSLPLVDEIWLTEIEEEVQGNIFFPDFKDGKFLHPGFTRSSLRKQLDFTSSPNHYEMLKYTKSK